MYKEKLLNEALQRYETMISNIEWHIQTNKPAEVEIKKLNTELDIYKEFVSVLNTLWQKS